MSSSPDFPRAASGEGRFVCRGCGTVVAVGELAAVEFQCPRRGLEDDVDHLLEPDPGTRDTSAALDAAPTGADEANPFVRYRSRLTAWRLAMSRGWPDDEFVRLVRELDAGIALVDGRGFGVTPFGRSDALSRRIGFSEAGGVWAKNETGNVSGSHKARHLAGVLLYLQVVERAGPRDPAVAQRSRRRLAIASCGNAALAAAVVARAARRRLDVYIPPSANASVVERLRALGAHAVVCRRDAGQRGDPCYLQFRAAIASGSLPFCCQGPDNALTIEGGETLAWEMVDAPGGAAIDRVFVQVGGGALASAVIRGLRDGRPHGPTHPLPRVHAVQTTGGFPLARAWARFARRALDEVAGGTVPAHGLDALNVLADARGDDPQLAGRLALLDPSSLAHAAELLAAAYRDGALERARLEAVTHRSRFMWAWEREPCSIAHGILDDETYDWRAVVDGMLASAGWPIVVSEELLRRANEMARAADINADHTGSSGLAGLLALQTEERTSGAASPRRPAVRADERVVVIFSGAER